MSTARAQLFGRCPRCGVGSIFSNKNPLKLAAACPVCGVDFSQNDVGDGPAFFVGTFWCFAAAIGAVVAELTLAPPLWLNLLVCLLVMLVGSLPLLRLVRSILLHQQFRLRLKADGSAQDGVDAR